MGTYGDRVPRVASVGDMKVLVRDGWHRVGKLHVHRSVSNRIRLSRDSLSLKSFHELRVIWCRRSFATFEELYGDAAKADEHLHEHRSLAASLV